MLTIYHYSYGDGVLRYAIYSDGNVIIVFDTLSAALDALALLEDCE
jgi:hypothetical protein